MTKAPRSFEEIFRRAEEREEYWIEGAKLEFTEELVAQMERQGVSRAELARRIGKSPAYVTKILRGSTNFTLESMVRIARGLGCEFRSHLLASGKLPAVPFADELPQSKGRDTRAAGRPARRPARGRGEGPRREDELAIPDDRRQA